MIKGIPAICELITFEMNNHYDNNYYKPPKYLVGKIMMNQNRKW